MHTGIALDERTLKKNPAKYELEHIDKVQPPAKTLPY